MSQPNNAPNILIAVPAYGGSVKTACAESLVSLALALVSAGIRFNLSTANRSDIALVRNMFASMVADGSEFTHLLMIDADMGFAPRGILKMLQASKPVIGWVAPKRQRPLTFNIRQTSPIDSFDGSLCAFEAVGTGVMLIEAVALRTLRDTGKLATVTSHELIGRGYDGPLHGFFDRIDTQGSRYSEDVSFCMRWRELCGGTVLGLVDEDISHVGEMVITGSFLGAAAHAREQRTVRMAARVSRKE